MAPSHVSIITPVYNGERFIAEAIDSVLGQTCTDWELIVVDDGSTDATPNILARFADSRIRVLRQANGGEASARNTGLDAATGELLTFLDADDLYFPNALADFVAYFESHPKFDVVYSDGIMCDEDKKPLVRLSETRTGIYEGHILEHVVLTSMVITVPVCVALRRQALEAAGLRFDTTLKYAVDWDLWVRLAVTARFGYLDRLTCQYRVHQQNMTRAVSLSQRKRDLLPSQRKVLDAPWFGQLGVSTRSAFSYHVLVDLLGDQPEQQRTILDAAPLLALPAGTRADLLRLVGSSHLINQPRKGDTEYLQNVAFALDCLRRSLALQPHSLKGRLLLELASRSPPIAAAVLSLWQKSLRAVADVRALGRRKPRPVPDALMPSLE